MEKGKMGLRELFAGQGFCELSHLRKCGMIEGCEQYDDLLIPIASLGFVHGPRSGASLVT